MGSNRAQSVSLKESDTATSSGTFKNGGVVDAFKRKTSSSGSAGIASESDAMDIDKEAAEGDQSDAILDLESETAPAPKNDPLFDETSTETRGIYRLTPLPL